MLCLWLLCQLFYGIIIYIPFCFVGRICRILSSDVILEKEDRRIYGRLLWGCLYNDGIGVLYNFCGDVYMKLTLIRHTTPDVPKGTIYGKTDVLLKSTFEAEAEIVIF